MGTKTLTTFLEKIKSVHGIRHVTVEATTVIWEGPRDKLMRYLLRTLFTPSFAGGRSLWFFCHSVLSHHSARNMGLVINQEKTVYMHIEKETTLHQDLAIGNYIFKRMDSFKYLGTMVNKMNNRSVEVNARLTMANRSYYGLQNHMKSRIISRNTKHSSTKH
jgi:hypothetical protein